MNKILLLCLILFGCTESKKAETSLNIGWSDDRISQLRANHYDECVVNAVITSISFEDYVDFLEPIYSIKLAHNDISPAVLFGGIRTSDAIDFQEAKIISNKLKECCFCESNSCYILFMVTECIINPSTCYGNTIRTPDWCKNNELGIHQNSELGLSKETVVEVLVNQSGKVLIDGVPIRIANIKSMVRQLIEINPRLIFSVQVTKETKYDSYIKVLDQLKLAGASKISIAEPTEKLPEPPAHPSVPVAFEDEFFDDEITIEDTDFDDFEDWETPPPMPGGPKVTFIPFDKPPKPKRGLGIRPIYPILAQEAGIEGIVYVQFFIDKEGNVTEAWIQKGLPNTGLDEAALSSVKKSKWKPAQQRGKKVGVWQTVPVVFTLE